MKGARQSRLRGNERRKHHYRFVYAALLLCLGMGANSDSSLSAQGPDSGELAPRHQRFLEDTPTLITPEERAAFESLQRDHQRDLFIRRFWEVRDPFPQSERNEFQERWAANLELAKTRYGDLGDPRARAILTLGAETRVFRSSCSELLQPLEVWVFEADPGVHPQLLLVFERVGAGRARSWAPRQGLPGLRSPTYTDLGEDDVFLRRVAEECGRGDELVEALTRAADLEEIERALGMHAEVEREWVQTFLGRTTDLPADAEGFAAQLSWSFPGIHQSRTVAQLTAAVDSGVVSLANLGGHSSYNFLLDGEILRDGTLFESFRYKFDLPPTDPEGPLLPIAIQRYLRPGSYEWIVRIQDLNAGSFFRADGVVEVPNPRVEAAPALPAALPDEAYEPTGSLELWSEANAITTVGSGDHSLQLLAPASESLLTDAVRIEARVVGENVARVAFELDGQRILSKARPPYSVEVNLGRAPREHSLTGIALSADDSELARDEIRLNGGPHRFSLRLIEPLRGRRYERSVRARAEVEVPQTESLERVEFFLNDERVATLYQPPFVVPIAIPENQELGYVRAIAFLNDGNSTEDLVFVNSPHPIDQIEVNLVELYVSVFDSKGQPAHDVVATDFKILEDRQVQTIRRFEPVEERPIYAGVLLDVSTSMSESLDEAEKAALRFFQSVLRPRDRASLMTFSDAPQLVVPFTNDVSRLAGGLSGLVSDGDTALHDSLIYALHSFAGLRGRRALVLISDGEDSSSDYRFEEVLDYSRRAGVAIYTVGLRISNGDIQIRNKLMRLAKESGGTSFFIHDAAELGNVYDKVESQLRSQFLIAYQSTSVEGRDHYREITVDLQKKGRKARTMQGYYP